MRRYLSVLTVIALAVVVALPIGLARAQEPSIAVLLDDEDRPELSRTGDYLGDAGLRDALASNVKYTVFAPTDEAWNAALDTMNTTEEAFITDNALLADVSTYHVVRGEFTAEELEETNFLVAQNRDNLAFDNNGDSININNGRATVTRSIPATNGVIHVVDSVLLPPSVTENPSPLINTTVDFLETQDRFMMLAELAEGAGYVDELATPGAFTVFAPNNESFTAALNELNMTEQALLADNDLLARLTGYHIVAGEFTSEEMASLNFLTAQSGENLAVDENQQGSLVLNNGQATVTESIRTSNGVIHVIDSVLLPPSVTGETSLMLTNVVDYIGTQDRFSTMEEAIQGAGVVDELMSQNSYTVFVPTDRAFEAALQELNISEQELLANSDLLADIVAYHMVVGLFTEDDLQEEENFLVSQSTQNIDISAEMGSITLNDGQATVTETIRGANGVIHVIDGVLLPPDMAE